MQAAGVGTKVESVVGVRDDRVVRPSEHAAEQVRVAAGTTVQQIIAGAPIEHVITRTTDEPVVASTAMQNVVAGIAG